MYNTNYYLICDHLDNSKTYKTDSITLINSNINIWSGNRPRDNIRVNEIKNYIIENKKIDGIIYITYLEDEGYVCYDGSNRFYAIQEYHKTLNEPLPVFIDYKKFNTRDDFIDKFISINKAVPVPEIYKENNSKKKLIIKIVNYLYEKYNNHMSTSSNFQRPNINRDKLTDIISNWLEFENNLDYNIIIENINKKNLILKNRMNNNNIKKISNNIKSKCVKNDCYLFLVSDFTVF